MDRHTTAGRACYHAAETHALLGMLSVLTVALAVPVADIPSIEVKAEHEAVAWWVDLADPATSCRASTCGPPGCSTRPSVAGASGIRGDHGSVRPRVGRMLTLETTHSGGRDERAQRKPGSDRRVRQQRMFRDQICVKPAHEGQAIIHRLARGRRLLDVGLSSADLRTACRPEVYTLIGLPGRPTGPVRAGCPPYTSTAAPSGPKLTGNG